MTQTVLRAAARSRALAWVAISLVYAMVACNQDAPASTATKESASAPTQVSSSSPASELADLDRRVPVPLQPMMAWHQKQNMMQHLVAIQQITNGLAEEDWEAVVKASTSIGSSPQMEQMCQHMGAGAEGFTEAALNFHRHADAIGAAARKKSVPEVLHATSATLTTCTACHSVYRQEVVDSATWQARTGNAHSPSMHDHAH